jgi:hypothetical protein
MDTIAQSSENREVIINKWMGSTVHCNAKRFGGRTQDDYLNPIPGEEDT